MGRLSGRPRGRPEEGAPVTFHRGVPPRFRGNGYASARQTARYYRRLVDLPTNAIGCSA